MHFPSEFQSNFCRDLSFSRWPFDYCFSVLFRFCLFCFKIGGQKVSFYWRVS